MKAPIRLLLPLLLTLTIILPAFANPLDIVVGAMGPSAPSGGRIQIPIYIHNTADHPVRVDLLPETPFSFTSGDETISVTGHRMDKTQPEKRWIHPQGFIKIRYALTLPEELEGHVYLTAVEYQNAGQYIAIAPKASPDAPDDDNSVAWLPRSTDQPLDDLIQLYQPYVKNISFYEPMYFLVGTEPEYSKFQLSLKYRFFNPEKPFVQRHPWLQGFHFGYTQTSFWDLDSDSAPFEDTSYKPELFYTSQRLETDLVKLDGFFLKTGYRHESNGRGGELSRSTNIFYIEPILLFYNEIRRTGLKITPRLWAYVDNDDETNPDLDRYRGYFNLGITFGKADNLVVDTNLGWAAEGGSIQVDLTYPLHTSFFNHLDMYIQAQYVSRLAESLIKYTERTEAFRLGLAIVR